MQIYWAFRSSLCPEPVLTGIPFSSVDKSRLQPTPQYGHIIGIVVFIRSPLFLVQTASHRILSNPMGMTVYVFN
jgi:hypothetical protein